MACIAGLRLNTGSPNDIGFVYPMGEGPGDAHSTDDPRDNITQEEGRGITIVNVYRTAK